MSRIPEDVSSRPSGDPTPPSDPAREAFRSAFQEYERLVEHLNIAQDRLAGIKPGIRGGFLWHVLTEDLTPDQVETDPRFAELHEGASVAINASREYMPVRIALVSPSRVPDLVRRYEENGYVFEESDHKEDSSESTDADNVEDMVIGIDDERRNALGKAKEIATQVKAVHPSIETDSSLEVFDGLRDQEAAALLKDITIARNTRSLPYNMADTLELMAEPFRVVASVLENVHDEESFRGISSLDVRMAVESGALIAHGGEPRKREPRM